MKKGIFIILISLIGFISPCFAADVNKYSYEEFYRYHQFQRTDGNGWLGESETLSSCDVKTYEQDTGIDTSATMVSGVGVDSSTRCKYMLKAGTAGKTYEIQIKTVTSTSQKFEDVLDLEVF